jgi:arginyl-tRNA synthetase
VVGDALGQPAGKAGYAVTKEYYINDAGAQVDKLGQSTFLRYQERWAIDRRHPRRPLSRRVSQGRRCRHRQARRRALDRQAAIRLAAGHARLPIDILMAEIKTDLETLGVRMDVYSSERARIDPGAVDRVPGAEPPGPDLSGPPRSAQGPGLTTGRIASRRCSGRPSSAMKWIGL